MAKSHWKQETGNKPATALIASAGQETAHSLAASTGADRVREPVKRAPLGALQKMAAESGQATGTGAPEVTQSEWLSATIDFL
jgi:hypothetical protein